MLQKHNCLHLRIKNTSYSESESLEETLLPTRLASQTETQSWLPATLKQAEFTLYHRFEATCLSETDNPEFA